MTTSPIATSYLDQLDDEQRIAVTAPTDHPILVLAAAGSGKTRSLTARVAWLIDQGCLPSSILAVTFTRAAAAELKSRVTAVVGPVGGGVEACTIHAFCFRLLRDYLRRVNVLESGQQRRLVADAVDVVYKELGVPEGDRRRLGWRYWMGWIEWAKAEGKRGARDIESKMEESRLGNYINRMYSEIAAEVLGMYEEGKGESYDFTDLLLKVRELVRDEKVLTAVRRRFQYVLIDEYQDTDILQLEILSRIADDKHLFMVGDPDQTLYSFRRARPEENVYGFRERFPDGLVLFLNTNYRSTQRIVNAGRALIHNNYLDARRAQYEKSIRPCSDAPDGPEFVAAYHHDASSEAAWVTKQIQGLLGNGYRERDVYVVARTNAALALPEEALSEAGVPAVSPGGSYWGRNGVRHVLSYLKLAHNRHDDDAWGAVYDIPSQSWPLTTRRLGRKFQDAVRAFAFGESMWDKMVAMEAGEAPFRRRAIGDFMAYVQRIEADLREYALADVVERLCQDYTAYWVKREGPDAVEDMEVLEAFPVMASRFQSWEGFMGLVRRMEEAGRNPQADAVVLSTIHGVKGLERPVVFGIGMSEGLLPHWMATGDGIDMGGGVFSRADMPPSPYDGTVEDERCAAYVLVTRARDRLYVSGSRTSGKKMGMRPSRFFGEMGLEGLGEPGVEGESSNNKEEQGDGDDTN